MKFTKRDARLLFILAGVVAFLLLYMLVYTPTKEKTDQVNARINQLKPQISELETHYMRLNTYETSIEQNRTQLLTAMQALPADVKEEDTLSYLLTMEKELGYFMESVSFRQPALFSQFDAMVHQNGEDVSTTVSAYRHSTVMTGQMTYQQAKQVLDYLYESPYQTVLDSIGLTYNAETGGLSVSFEISKFTLDWPGGVYRPEIVPPAEFGVPDLFGVQVQP